MCPWHRRLRRCRKSGGRLIKSGYSLRVIGRKPGLEIKGAEYQTCDINDFAGLQEVMRGCQAVVHMATILNLG